MKAKHIAFASLGVLIVLFTAIPVYLHMNPTGSNEPSDKQAEQTAGPIAFPYRLANHLSQAKIDLPPAGKSLGGVEHPLTFWDFPDFLVEWQLKNMAVTSKKDDSVVLRCLAKDGELISPPIGMPFWSVKEIRIGLNVAKENLSDEFTVFAIFEDMPVPYKLNTVSMEQEGLVEYKFNARTSGEHDPAMAARLGSLDRLKIVFHADGGPNIEVRHVRLFTKDHWYLENRCGVSRETLHGTWRDHIHALCPSEITFDVTLPQRCFIDMTLGNIHADKEVSYRMLIEEEGSADAAVVLSDTLPDGAQCKKVSCDLSEHAGKRIKLILKADSKGQEAVALWGNPTIHQGTDADQRGPNVILYVIDTLRADHLGCYGYDRPTSPRIDALAEKGVLFERCSAQSPWTSPSAASYLSSLYPMTHGVSIKRQPEGRLLDSMPTLPKVLRQHGFTTAAFVANPLVNSRRNLVDGFDSLVYFDGLADRAHGETYYEVYGEPSSRILHERISSWFMDNLDKQFFLYIHSMDPHWPYRPIAPYDSMFQREVDNAEATHLADKAFKDFIPAWRNSGPPSFEDFAKDYPQDELNLIAGKFRRERSLYDAEIRQNDDSFGRLMSMLDIPGVKDNTIVIVMSDHGEEFFERGLSGHGHSLHEFLVHVPLIIYYPPMATEGKRIDTPVELIDVFPTLLDLLGIEKPETLQGRSLVPLVEGRDTGTRSTYSYRGEFWNAASFTDMIPKLYGEQSHCLIDGNWKAIHRVFSDGTNVTELYNLNEDPAEQNDLSDANPDLAKKYVKMIERRIVEHKAAHERLRRDDRFPKETVVDVEELERLKTLGYVR